MHGIIFLVYWSLKLVVIFKIQTFFFIWLMFEQKNFTWKNLVKRGIYRTSRCVLCGNNEENVSHLFVECSFTCKNRIKKRENWKEIHYFICWEVWKHRNLVIFEDSPPNRIRVCNSILQDLGETKVSYSIKVNRIDRPPIHCGILWWCFTRQGW